MLPTGERKLELFGAVMDRFLAAGYVQIGMDHFALPHDELARASAARRLHRNFMGYTTKPATDMVGLGVSAIGDVAGAFVQNTKKLSTYYADLEAGRFPVERGYLLDAGRSAAARAHHRADVQLPRGPAGARGALRHRASTTTSPRELDELAAGPMADGLIERQGGGFEVTPRRPAARAQHRHDLRPAPARAHGADAGLLEDDLTCRLRPSDAAPIGILLFNLGGPGTLADVEPFLINLFSDRDIIELPLGALLQPIVARIIAEVARPVGAGELRAHRRRLAAAAAHHASRRRALEARLNDGGLRARTFIAMRYWQPTTEQALEAMAAEGISRVVTLTLFPHYSQATTGSSEKELAAGARAAEVAGAVHRHGHPVLPRRSAVPRRHGGHVARRALDGFPSAVRDRVVLLFSAHGLPQKFIDRGDPVHRGDRQDAARDPRASRACRTGTCSATSRGPAR